MSVTILETLENAEYNFQQNFAIGIALSQLHNAIVLLDKGYDIEDEVESLLGSTASGKIEDVPEKEG